jgi:holo-[acyl-carrier protein] synthase
VRVAIDLVSVASVRDAIQLHADRYLRRVYTEQELADCSGVSGAPDPTRLAARFAAKEAAMKVLRAGDTGLSMRSIEVRRSPDGWVDLALSGMAADLARERGLSGFALSVSHEDDYAAAVVVVRTADEAGADGREQRGQVIDAQ